MCEWVNHQKNTKERTIESHLRHYNTYKVGIVNCKKQLDYIMPSMVARYEVDGQGAGFYISNNTERVAIDRIESKRALDLHENIKQFEIICRSIDRAFKELQPQEQDFVKLRYFDCQPIERVKQEMGYSEDKSVYRIRRHVLDKLLISLNNLLAMK